MLIGVVAGGFARERIERTSVQMDLPIAIAPVAQAVIIVLFGLTAALQVGISTGPILLILTIGLIAITATVALAFGLGSREIARSLSAARYARADFSVERPSGRRAPRPDRADRQRGHGPARRRRPHPGPTAR